MDAQIASLTTSVFVGQLFGSMFWGPFADKYGRRFAYLVAGSTIAVASWASGFAPNYASLVFFRTIVGVGIGGSTVPFDLVAEFLPPNVRGSNLILLELFWTAGSMMVIGAAWLLLGSNGWRALIYVTAVPMTLVLVVAFWLLPESPRWLLSKGRFGDAEKIILQAARSGGVDIAPFTFNSHSLHGSDVEPISSSSTRSDNSESPFWSNSYHCEEETNKVVASSPSSPGKFGGLGSAHSTFKSTVPAESESSQENDTHGGRDGLIETDSSNKSLFTICKSYAMQPFVEVRKALRLILSSAEDRKSTGFLAIIWISFGFTYYGLILLVTRLYKESDGNDNNNSSNSSSNATCSFDFADIFVNSSGEIPGVIITYLLVDRIGRRPSQTSSYLLGACCLVIIGCISTSSKAAILSIALIARACAMSASCLTWVVTPELYKTEARASAHSFLNCLARIGAGAAPFFVVSSLDTLAIAITLGIINGIAAFSAFNLRETVGGAMDSTVY